MVPVTRAFSRAMNNYVEPEGNVLARVAPECWKVPFPCFLGKPETCLPDLGQLSPGRCRYSDDLYQPVLKEVAEILLRKTSLKTATTCFICRNLSAHSNEVLKSEGLRLSAILRRFQQDFKVVSKGKSCNVDYLKDEVYDYYPTGQVSLCTDRVISL
eukprot:TRINITY_DN5315_c0_g1_i4.p1 TRINITY_DN5315_c0_g1~~TRINITY_DN5315_c0_g1_i4.p1  ORF type:complete len:157 (+),score=18.82 TRINITY_DN5315_c0_g1_i4:149-619(+)